MTRATLTPSDQKDQTIFAISGLPHCCASTLNDLPRVSFRPRAPGTVSEIAQPTRHDRAGWRNQNCPVQSRTNSGNGPDTYTSSFRRTGFNQFSQTNTCPATIYPGGSCNVTVTFTPTASESLRVELIATDNASGKKQLVLITRAGVP